VEGREMMKQATAQKLKGEIERFYGDQVHVVVQTFAVHLYASVDVYTATDEPTLVIVYEDPDDFSVFELGELL